MAFDEQLADRVRWTMKSKGVVSEEKKMMGGLTFMVDDKMCVGIIRDSLMVRVHPEKNDDLLKIKGARIMDFTKRPMKGFLIIEPEGIDLDEDLVFWVDEALAYNPIAKSSKKKKKR